MIDLTVRWQETSTELEPASVLQVSQSNNIEWNTGGKVQALLPYHYLTLTLWVKLIKWEALLLEQILYLFTASFSASHQANTCSMSCVRFSEFGPEWLYNWKNNFYNRKIIKEIVILDIMVWKHKQQQLCPKVPSVTSQSLSWTEGCGTTM